MLQQALIGMGSNIDPEHYLKMAAAAIRSEYPDVLFSHVYRSQPIGMSGGDFLNACCCLHTGLGTEATINWLKSLEQEAGRKPSHDPWEPRTLDLDLLMLGDRTLDEGLFQYDHVRIPAMELMDLPFPRSSEANVNTYPALRL